MKMRFQVTGVTRLNDMVRIFLDRQDLIQEKEPGLLDMVKNMEGMQIKMQQKAVLTQAPDVITIPFTEYERKLYKIGDYVWIDFDVED